MLGPLTYLSVQFVQDAVANRTRLENLDRMEQIIAEEVKTVAQAELVEWNHAEADNVLKLEIIIRTSHTLIHSESVALRDAISLRL